MNHRNQIPHVNTIALNDNITCSMNARVDGDLLKSYWKRHTSFALRRFSALLLCILTRFPLCLPLVYRYHVTLLIVCDLWLMCL